ncbi:restriction endonuclease subunit S [Xanthomonas campestris pv. zinniae]|nr:restriction endonuclease subunit S [Xanthomonas campestris pv. zinniae]
MKANSNGLIPKLRFPGFDEAWLSASIRDLYEFKSTNTLSRDKLNYNGGGIRNIHYGDIHKKFSPRFILANEEVPFVNHEEMSVRLDADSFCVAGDMVLADASEDVDDVGKSIEIIDLNGERVVAGLHTILARRTGDELTIGFGAHVFRSPAVREQIRRESQGAKVLGISPTRLGDVLLPYPSEQKEQRKIADCLALLDACIGVEARKLDTLKAHRQGLMQQIFPAEGQRLPCLRFRGFMGEWDKKPLGKAATFYNGRAYKQEELLDEGKYRVLRVGNFFTSNHWYFSDLELDETKYCEKGDLLYAWSASFGPRVWRGDKVIYHYHIWKVVEAKGIDKNYLFFLLRFETERMKSKSANGLGLMHVTKGAIEAWECSFPHIVEQQKIAACLATLDDLVSAQVRRVSLLQQQKKGLMQGLFPVMEAYAP